MTTFITFKASFFCFYIFLKKKKRQFYGSYEHFLKIISDQIGVTLYPVLILCLVTYDDITILSQPMEAVHSRTVFVINCNEMIFQLI